LEGDNRKNQRRSCLSIEKLRQIAEEGISIHANIGNYTSKITRILAQAETWYEQYQHLLVRCNLEGFTNGSPPSCVELSEMTKAVESASSDVSLDLDEAVELKNMMEKIEKWIDRVSIVAPKRSKRHSRTTRSKFTVDDLVGLIEEASSLPVNTEDEVKRLQIQLSTVQTWRLQAAHELERIGSGFSQLRESINLAYGLPKDFCLSRKFGEDDEDEKTDPEDVNNGDSMEVQESADVNNPCEDNLSHSDTASTAESEEDATFAQLEKGDDNVHRMIRELQKGAKGNGVVTSEAEMANLLESVSRWCLRSLKYLSSPREVFDKRFYGAFDRFIKEGHKLHEKAKKSGSELGVETLDENLGSSWRGIVGDQLERLEILRSEREKFTEWCDLANQILSDEKKMTVEKLNEIAEQSRSFPAGK
jgi:hypothetical protein